MSTNIKVSGALVFPEGVPTRAGEVVNSIDEMCDIPAPRVGMIVYDRSTGLNYIVRSLKAKVIDGVQVDDAQVDEYELHDVASETTRAMEAENNIRAVATRYNSLHFTAGADKVGLQGQSISGQDIIGLAIPAATTEMAGVMSAKDKVRLEQNTTDIAAEITRATGVEEALGESLNGLYKSANSIKDTAARYDGNAFSSTANEVKLTTTGTNTSKQYTVILPAATTETAGVMSAEDKNLLNNSAQGKDVPMLLRTNYYDPDDVDFVAGAYLDMQGDFITNDGYCVTGYIPLNSVIGQLLCTRNGKIDTLNGGCIGFYTEDKQPLFFKQVAANNGLAEWEYKVAYVRFSIRRYFDGHVQIENGREYTTEIGYGESTWNGNFPINVIEPKSFSQIFGIEKTPNLINHADLQRGIAAYISDGELKYTTVSGMCVSGLIEVKPLTTYTFWYSFQYFFLDADKKVIGGKNELIGTASAMTPENCRYMVINFYYERSGLAMYDLDATARMYEGDVLYPYIPYGVATDSIQTYMLQQTLSSMGNKAARFPRSSVAAQGIAKTADSEFPYSIKDNQIAFSGNFDAFETLVIGRGITNNAYSGCRFEINETSIALFKNDGAWSQMATVEHGLMMNSYIKVLISERKSKVLVSIQTLAGSFEHEFDYWGANGQITAMPSMPMVDTILSVSNPAFKCPVWMFGDSYYGAEYENRQMYWLRRWGYDNMLIQSFGGQGSNNAYNDLLRCFKFGTPRFLVWSLGMNDDNSNDLDDIKTGVWYTTYQKVRKICEVMNIELILTTIPEVRSSSCKNKDKMSEVVRNSGLRYIDAAKAVGSNAQGQWYGNGTEYDYQSNDNVHPSKYGAKAIANQFLIDFPEIMQY